MLGRAEGGQRKIAFPLVAKTRTRRKRNGSYRALDLPRCCLVGAKRNIVILFRYPFPPPPSLCLTSLRLHRVTVRTYRSKITHRMLRAPLDTSDCAIASFSARTRARHACGEACARVIIVVVIVVVVVVVIGAVRVVAGTTIIIIVVVVVDWSAESSSSSSFLANDRDSIAKARTANWSFA